MLRQKKYRERRDR